MTQTRKLQASGIATQLKAHTQTDTRTRFSSSLMGIAAESERAVVVAHSGSASIPNTCPFYLHSWRGSGNRLCHTKAHR